MRKMLLFLILPFILSSCSNTIDGNSEEVKSLVLELVRKEMTKYLTPYLLYQNYKAKFGENSYPYVGYPSFEELQKISNSIETPFKDIKPNIAKEVVAEIEKINQELQISNVRTIEENVKQNIVSCEAIVEGYNNEQYEISYTAQLTDDKNNIFVKLLSIKRIY